MKLLVVTPEFEPTSGGGIVAFYAQLLRPMRALGVEIDVIVGSAFSQPGGTFEVEGIRVHGLDGERFARRLGQFGHLAALPEVARHLAAAWAIRDLADHLGLEPDVVEATDWGLLFVPWVDDPRAPVLVRLHGSCAQIAQREGGPRSFLLASVYDAIERVYVSAASSACTYAQVNRDEWASRLQRDVHYLPPAQPLLEPATRTGESWQVLARVQSWKGPAVLATALGSDPSIRDVDWMGRDVPHEGRPGTSTDAELARAHPAVWRRRIHPRGTIPANEARARLRSAFGVICPSTWDVFNFTVAEAMAAGQIVVCSDGAGASELVEDGVSGYRFPAGDARACADALRRAQQASESVRGAICARARAIVAERLDPRRVAERNLELLERAPPPTSCRGGGAVEALVRPSEADGTAATDALLEGLGLRLLARHIGRRALLRLR